jgi:hypothetical protein
MCKLCNFFFMCLNFPQNKFGGHRWVHYHLQMDCGRELSGGHHIRTKLDRLVECPCVATEPQLNIILIIIRIFE